MMKDNTPTPLENFRYKIKDNNIILQRHIRSDKFVNILPEYTINNQKYKVKELNKHCFAFNLIEKITIPDTIKILPDQCFWGCKKLNQIELPNTIIELGENCFNDCTSLTNITIPNSVIEIKEECFHSTNLKKIKLPNNLTKIPDGCFLWCSNLEEVELPENITEIGQSSFVQCEKLKKINIPKKIQLIDTDAFVCTNINLNNFENQYIKIENNNIYQKEKTSNDKIIYILNNCYQKDSLLNIKENERIYNVRNDTITDIIIDTPLNKNWQIEQLIKPINTLIIKNTIDINAATINVKQINHLFINDIIGDISYLDLNNKLQNIYYNGTKKEFEEKKGYENIYYKNLIYKKDINELLEDGYSFKQIDQIIKGYQKNILLSNSNKDIDYLLLKDIVNHFNYDDIELYGILELLQKEELTLEDQLKIAKMIQKQIKNKEKDKNIKNQDIEK